MCLDDSDEFRDVALVVVIELLLLLLLCGRRLGVEPYHKGGIGTLCVFDHGNTHVRCCDVLGVDSRCHPTFLHTEIRSLTPFHDLMHGHSIPYRTHHNITLKRNALHMILSHCLLPSIGLQLTQRSFRIGSLGQRPGRPHRTLLPKPGRRRQRLSLSHRVELLLPLGSYSIQTSCSCVCVCDGRVS